MISCIDFNLVNAYEENEITNSNSIIVGGMLELSEAIRDYHDATLFPNVVSQSCSDLLLF